LEAGGSTAGGKWIELAYQVATENYIEGGNNRVILATDGDFNVGPSSDAELGAGHSVTALYEIIPVGADEAIRSTPELKYQETELSAEAEQTNELMTVKLRYKQPDGDESILMVHPVLDESISLDQSSDDLRFAAAVAEFGLLLRDSPFKGDATYAQVLELAQGSKGQDEQGYRAEFIRLVEPADLLQ
jgi:Ca-activated chloride channel family protein